MLRVAFLGSQFAGQLSQYSLDGVEVLWVGTSPRQFIAEVPLLEPDVIVLDLAELGARPDDEVREFIARCDAELTVVTFSFARRALVRSLQAANVRVLQSPISLELLQSHLAPLVVRQTLNQRTSQRQPPPPVDAKSPPQPVRFSRQQLGALMEVTSTVKCECPNHLAQVVDRLQAFESYSKDCESTDPTDRAIHTMLYEATAAARAKMEDALEKLVAHEKLQLP